MPLRILVLILIGFISGEAFAQPSSVIDLSTPDKERLEKFTHLCVNKIRKEKKLPDLLWDEVLHRAAEDHANYLIKNKTITHYQTVKGKRTPAERVKIHGGVIYTAVGENIVAIPLGVEVLTKGRVRSTVTYESAAQVMAESWRNSPGHYKNIISEKYNCTAIAVAYDSSTQRLVAVQVFGFTSTPSDQFKLPDHSDSLLSLPKKKLPYHLKDYRYASKNRSAANKFLAIDVDRGYVTCSYKTAKKIFKGRRSGLAQEFIPIEQFDSNAQSFASVPNRRTGLYELNGELTKPIYRGKLFQYNRRYGAHPYLKIAFLYIRLRPTQFIFPLQPNSADTEFNLFLIKQKRLEAFVTYNTVCGSLFHTPYSHMEYSSSFRIFNQPEKFEVYHRYDTLQLKIYYQSGKVMIDSLRQSEIKQQLGRVRGKIVLVEGSAFASIDGNKTSNAQLADGRMDNFMVLVKPWLDTSAIQPKLTTREQWDLFYKQIEGTPYEFLNQKSEDSIRLYVNQHKADTALLAFMNKERYMEIKLVWRLEFKKYFTLERTARYYDSIYQRVVNNPKPKSTDLALLEKVQLEYYYKVAESDSLATIYPKVPVLEKYPAFQYHELVFNYRVRGVISDEEFYYGLHQLTKSKYFPGRLRNQAIYNNLALIYQMFDEHKLQTVFDYDRADCPKYRQSEFLLKKFKKIKCKRNKHHKSIYAAEYFILKEMPQLINYGRREYLADFPATDLWKYYYLYSIHALYRNIPIPGELYRLLPGFKTYFHPNDARLSDEERLKLAYFYCSLLRFNTAKELVEPIATRAEPDKEALMLYIALMRNELTDDHEYAEFVMAKFPKLGIERWCDLFEGQCYVNFLLLEDLKLKQFYNCNCDK